MDILKKVNQITRSLHKNLSPLLYSGKLALTGLIEDIRKPVGVKVRDLYEKSESMSPEDFKKEVGIILGKANDKEIMDRKMSSLLQTLSPEEQEILKTKLNAN